MRKLFLILMMFVASNSYANIVDYAEKDDFDKVKECIKKGVDVNTRNKNGNTALLFAVMRGHSEIVYLVENGANINMEDEYGNTALTLASGNKIIEDYLKSL